MPNDLELKRADGAVFGRCEKISAPVLECDFGLGTERITSRLKVVVANEKDKLIIDAIMDYAKRTGVTDLVLLDEEFVKSAIIHEIERRRNDAE